jgi:hypothetical protein
MPTDDESKVILLIAGFPSPPAINPGWTAVRKDVSLERLTFPFPFVHLQPLDWKLEQLLTVETKSPGKEMVSTG